MISESYYWKQDLLKDADIIDRWSQKKLTERSRFLLEKKLFFAGYSIRKLIEARKIDKGFHKISIEKFPKTEGRGVDLLNWHRIDKLYALEKASKETQDIEFFCNLIIHSFIFILAMNECECPSSFFVTSWKRKENLYRIEIDVFTQLMKRVGEFDIISLRMIRNSKRFGGFEIGLNIPDDLKQQLPSTS